MQPNYCDVCTVWAWSTVLPLVFIVLFHVRANPNDVGAEERAVSRLNDRVGETVSNAEESKK